MAAKGLKKSQGCNPTALGCNLFAENIRKIDLNHFKRRKADLPTRTLNANISALTALIWIKILRTDAAGSELSNKHKFVEMQALVTEIFKKM